jgi:hypothetical protein
MGRLKRLLGQKCSSVATERLQMVYPHRLLIIQNIFVLFKDPTPSNYLYWTNNTVVSATECRKTFGAKIKSQIMCMAGTGPRSICHVNIILFALVRIYFINIDEG